MNCCLECTAGNVFGQALGLSRKADFINALTARPAYKGVINLLSLWAALSISHVLPDSVLLTKKQRLRDLRSCDLRLHSWQARAPVGDKRE